MGSGATEIASGETLEVVWDGWVFEEEAPDLDLLCPMDCGEEECFPFSCRRRLAASAGAHTVVVDFATGPYDDEWGEPEGPWEEVEVAFELPTVQVEVLID